MASGILTEGGIPKNQEKAKELLEKVKAGEVTLHPAYENEILNLLVLASEGKKIDSEPTKEAFNEFAELFEMNAFNIPSNIKNISATDFENRLSQFISEYCGSQIYVSINKYSQEHIGCARVNFELNFSAQKA